jgi:hypothetical protein
MVMPPLRQTCCVKVRRSLVIAVVCALAGASPARAWDNLAIIYGLGEYAEYNDNLNNSNKGQIKDTAINTAPDLSIVYDDGKTRWLARGMYRRESFLENRAGSGDYVATSGEFSRVLTDRATFSLLGSYTRQQAFVIGSALTEPGQTPVIVPNRGSTTVGTFWSPELTVFWSRRFRTSLIYSDRQSFSIGSVNQINRDLTFTSAYAFSPQTIGQLIVSGSRSRNSGAPFVFRGDTNGFVAQVGLSHTFSRRLTLDCSAGPQWTDQVMLPDRVTLLKRISSTVFDPLFGTFDQLLVMKEPHKKVNRISLSAAFDLALNYQWDANTRLSVGADRSTTSGQGLAGTQQQDVVRVAVERALGQRWALNLSGAFMRTSSIYNQFAILVSKDPVTGETQAEDRNTFDLPRSQKVEEVNFQPRIDFRINRWWNAYGAWSFVDYRETGSFRTRYQVNRVMLGLEFRREARY